MYAHCESVTLPVMEVVTVVVMVRLDPDVGTLDRVKRFFCLDKVERSSDKGKDVNHSAMNIVTRTDFGLDRRKTKCMAHCIGKLDHLVLDVLAARTMAGLL